MALPVDILPTSMACDKGTPASSSLDPSLVLFNGWSPSLQVVIQKIRPESKAWRGKLLNLRMMMLIIYQIIIKIHQIIVCRPAGSPGSCPGNRGGTAPWQGVRFSFANTGVVASTRVVLFLSGAATPVEARKAMQTAL